MPADAQPGSRTVGPEIRFAQWEDRTRLVVETRGRIPWQSFELENTDTVVVLLDGMAIHDVRKALSRAVNLPHPLIRDFHLTGNAHTSRLTLSLTRPAKVSLFILRPMDGHAHRLVLDLFPSQGPNVNGSLAETGTSRTSSAGSASAAAETQELWLAAQVNQGQDARTVLVLQQESTLWMSKTDLERWRIDIPTGVETREWAGESYVSLHGMGIRTKLDMRQLTLALDVPVHLLGRTRLGGAPNNAMTPTSSPFGAFFNYDVNVTRNGNGEHLRRDGFFEIGAFNGWGSGTSSVIVRDDADDAEAVRLETVWRKDDPTKMRSLLVGDTVNGGTGWSGAVRFGGLHWGTNFSTRPDFITMPLVSLAGEASVPSTVDLYVNDALRWREDVPAGPFSIDEIPTVTGSGELRVVVRDIFGREQIVTRDFYGSSQLLRDGLQEWSVDVGTVRERYGVESNNYGTGIFAATWRRGLDDELTVEGHVQATGGHHMGGLGLRWKLPFRGTLALAGAASGSDTGDGSLASIGIQYQGERFGVGAESQYVTDAFRRLGVSAATPLPTLQHRAHVGVGETWLGSASLGYTSQAYHDRDDVEFLTLNVSRNLGAYVHLGVSAFHFPSTQETGVQALFTVPLGARTTASAGGSARSGGTTSGDSTSGWAQVQRSLPAGTGFGYRLRAGLGDDEFDQAAVSYQSNVGTWTLEGSRQHETTAARVNARGGFALLDGNVLASRYIDQSFAVVDVGDVGDVRLYADNQVVARTNQRGVALIPRLRAYQPNRIAVEQADLPLNVDAGALEQTVAPFYRSGVFLQFDARLSRNALFRLVSNGQPVPAGALVTDEAGNAFPVGMNGEVYVTGLSANNRFTAQWRDQLCTFDLTLAPSDGVAYAEPGDITCTE